MGLGLDESACLSEASRLLRTRPALAHFFESTLEEEEEDGWKKRMEGQCFILASLCSLTIIVRESERRAKLGAYV